MKTALLFSFFTDVLIAIRVILTGRSLKKQWKYFWTRSVTCLHEAIACFCFFHWKNCDQDYTPADCPTIFTSYHFFILPFSPLCFIFERSDTSWLCDHFHPWQTVAGRHRPLWHIVPCQDNVTHTAPDGSYFIIFSSFFKFAWLLFIFYLIDMVLNVYISSGHIAPCP